MLKSAYYQSSVSDFIKASPDEILGELSRAHSFALEGTQRDAWLSQIQLLKSELCGLSAGQVYFEFAIPRMGKRADVVLLADNIVYVIEFKVGSNSFDRGAIEQVHDYALDLKNFHSGSHDASILPILIATKADQPPGQRVEWASDKVAHPILLGPKGLGAVVGKLNGHRAGKVPSPDDWERSSYQPTPTIVEAAQALYRDHSVDEISRSDAGAKNLHATARCIRQIVANAKLFNRKSICFVTGVPGSGKTLAGLNIATETADKEESEQAVFLSGNGPLVTVLREALARDQAARTGCKKEDAVRRVSSFVQNIHHFRDEALRDRNPPHERIVIFDEAQRAWTKEQASKFMQQKRSIPDFDQSEPDFLISVMDRHDDWCVIICLVGGGQEINTGEAGLAEWMTALSDHYSDWHIHLSKRLGDPDYGLLEMAPSLQSNARIAWEDDLHLSVSMRSFRAEHLSEFVGHLLDNQQERARTVLNSFSDRYPLVMTRNLETARAWLRIHARGSERTGLIASSGAYRLRPDGVNVRAKIDPANWFLNGPSDVRSAFYLEEVATEFDVQGLELDWAGVCWDADLRHTDGHWEPKSFRGTVWQNVNSAEAQSYLKNAYRVILTRARQGMVIFVPSGNPADRTRLPKFYDGVARYLASCGVQCIDDD